MNTKDLKRRNSEKINRIDAPYYFDSPYIGDSDNVFSVCAVANNGKTIEHGIEWGLDEDITGISIKTGSNCEGVITVKPNVGSTKINIWATKNGLKKKTQVFVAEKTQGIPNLARLKNASCQVNGNILKDFDNLCDGNIISYVQFVKTEGTFDTDTYTFSVDTGDEYGIDMIKTLVKMPDIIGKEIIYANVGNSIDTITTSIGTMGMATIYADKYAWTNVNAGKYRAASVKIPLSGGVKQQVLKMYEFEVYNTTLRINSIECDENVVLIPQKQSNTLQFTAFDTKGDALKEYQYKGESYLRGVKWSLDKVYQGITIDSKTGLLTVTANALPAAIKVNALYFGMIITKNINVLNNLENDDAICVSLDSSWVMTKIDDSIFTAVKSVKNEKLNELTDNIILYTQAPNNSIVAWQSDMPEIISNNGVVNRPVVSNANVKLTATISKGNNKEAKEINVTVLKLDKFTDKISISDEEFFGVWDEENLIWTTPSKFNYDAYPKLIEIKQAVQKGDYDNAKAKLLEYTKIKEGKNSKFVGEIPIGGDFRFKNYFINYAASGFYGPVNLSESLGWTSVDIPTNWIGYNKTFNIRLMMQYNDETLIKIWSKENSDKSKAPYIEVTTKSGKQLTIPVYEDSYIKPGSDANRAFNKEPFIELKGSTASWGEAFTAETRRPYFLFKSIGLDINDEVEKATLNLYTENITHTGKRPICLIHDEGDNWTEDKQLFCWNSTNLALGLYSWNNNLSGFDWMHPAGSDRETLFNPLIRMANLSNCAGLYYYTKDDSYAHTALNQIVNYFGDMDKNVVAYTRMFDGVFRAKQFNITYPIVMNSKAYNKEINASLWKYFYQYVSELNISESPYYDGVGNMAIMETSVLYDYSAQYFEFVGQNDRLTNAINRQIDLMNDYVMPDGAYVEASSGYSWGAIDSYYSMIEKSLNAEKPVCEDYISMVDKAARYTANFLMNNGALPVFGDDNRSEILAYRNYSSDPNATLLGKWSEGLFDPELAYIASYGMIPGSIKPSWTGFAYPFTMRFSLRSGWDFNDMFVYTNMDNGMGGHNHNDDLSITFSAFGRTLITDNGRYSYSFTDPNCIYAYSSIQHNTLGRIYKDGKIYVQTPELRSKGTSPDDFAKVNAFISTDKADFFSGTLLPNKNYAVTIGENASKGETGDEKIDIAFNRNILMVKPDYLIVSDNIKDEAQVANEKYQILFHTEENSNPSIDIHNKVICTNFDGTANVIIASADEDVNISEEISSLQPKMNNSIDVPRFVIEKTAGDTITPVTFDTVIVPVAQNSNMTVIVKKIYTGVDSSIATAMSITREQDAKVLSNDYYYLSYEDTPTKRTIMGKCTDAKLAFVSYKFTGEIASIILNNSTTFLDNEKILFESNKLISSLTIDYQETKDSNAVNVDIQSDNKKITDFVGITIYSDYKVDAVSINNYPVDFIQIGNIVKVTKEE